jgi:2-oxoglutarate dehydrogenase E2 component (dihydrolipoamide succinyltransferase)
MRLAPALVLATLLAAGPAFAQDATTPAAPAEAAPAAPAAPAEPAPAPVPPPDVATIGPNADRDFWCALAYSLTARAGQIGGNEVVAAGEAAKSQMLFAGLVTTMKAGNFGEAQFNALTAQYTIALLDPFASPKFTPEQCDVAVTEAKAIVDAATAAAPADPAAPAADAPAAPAADAPATK